MLALFPMPTARTRRRLIAFALALLLWLPTALWQATARGQRLLILHSAGETHPAGQRQQEGITRALEDAGFRPGVEPQMAIQALGISPEADDGDAISRRIASAVSRIARFRPDVLLTIGDPAFAWVALPLSGTPVNIVFSGLREQPETYDRFIHFMKTRQRPGSNITGIYEKRHIRRALEVLSRVTDLKTVRMVHDPSAPGRAIAEQIALELVSSEAPSPLPWRTEQVTLASWEAFEREIIAISHSPEIDAVYLGALMFRDAAGRVHSNADIVRYAAGHARKPIIGIDDVAIRQGLYGGTAVDFFAMGYQAGEKVAAILNGAEAGNLPIQDAQTVTLIFNLVRCRALGLQIPSEILLAADEIVNP